MEIVFRLDADRDRPREQAIGSSPNGKIKHSTQRSTDTLKGSEMSGETGKMLWEQPCGFNYGGVPRTRARSSRQVDAKQRQRLEYHRRRGFAVRILHRLSARQRGEDRRNIGSSS